MVYNPKRNQEIKEFQIYNSEDLKNFFQKYLDKEFVKKFQQSLKTENPNKTINDSLLDLDYYEVMYDLNKFQIGVKDIKTENFKPNDLLVLGGTTYFPVNEVCEVISELEIEEDK